jgi:hypothetical protein
MATSRSVVRFDNSYSYIEPAAHFPEHSSTHAGASLLACQAHVEPLELLQASSNAVRTAWHEPLLQKSHSGSP